MAEVKRGHLTAEEREIISILHSKYKGVREIAREVGRSPATISRELNRPEAKYYKGNYMGRKTHDVVRCNWARTHYKKKLAKPMVREYVIKAIRHRWSPELIAGRLRTKFGIKIHHQTIYRFIKEEKPELKKYLARKRFRRRNKINRPMISLIPNRVDISKRPTNANERVVFGHFEADTVLSSRQTKHALVVLVDRATRKTHIKRLVNKKALETSNKIISLLKKYPKKHRKTITYDNGTEFAMHDTVNEELKTKSYFCTPYSAWEKGTVENINGIIRRFYPKGTDFDLISDAELQLVEKWINNRPMKILEFKTPNEKFKELTGVTIA